MYSSNLVNLLGDFWKADRKELALDPADDIVKGCVITRDGEVVNETIRKLL